MTSRWLVSFANLVLVSYALDAGLSLGEELFRAATGSGLLLASRNALALLVGYLCLLSLPLLWLTPRLPLGPFLLLSVSIFWLATGAAPLRLMVGSASAMALVCALIQVATAFTALLWCRRRNGGEAWLIRADAFEGPLFSLRHSAVFTAVGALVGLPVLAFYAVLSLLVFVEVGTQGFVSFDWAGISLGDRRYERHDREVRLVGMMHIGEEANYAEIVRSFARESTIVLEEGVSDDEALLSQPLSYESAADFLGLATQNDLRSYLLEPGESEPPEWPVLRNADLDLSEFDPRTIEWLAWVGELWSSDEPWRALQELSKESAENQQRLEVVSFDILDRRNLHLLAELDRALVEYRKVVVPWGALHLPFIESKLVERGFGETARERHRLVSWMTVVAAVF